MTKSDLIKQIAHQCNLMHRDAEVAVDTIFGSIDPSRTPWRLVIG